MKLPWLVLIAQEQGGQGKKSVKGMVKSRTPSPPYATLWNPAPATRLSPMLSHAPSVVLYWPPCGSWRRLGLLQAAPDQPPNVAPRSVPCSSAPLCGVDCRATLPPHPVMVLLHLLCAPYMMVGAAVLQPFCLMQPQHGSAPCLAWQRPMPCTSTTWGAACLPCPWHPLRAVLASPLPSLAPSANHVAGCSLSGSACSMR